MDWLNDYDRKRMNADKRIEVALEFIMQYGGIDGAHHKQFALDQVVRILTNSTPHADTYGYMEWVRKYESGEDGPLTFEWYTGVAP